MGSRAESELVLLAVEGVLPAEVVDGDQYRGSKLPTAHHFVQAGGPFALLISIESGGGSIVNYSPATKLDVVEKREWQRDF